MRRGIVGVLAGVAACGHVGFDLERDAADDPDAGAAIDGAPDVDGSPAIDANTCAYRCTIDAVAGTTTCAGAIAVTQNATRATAIIDMAGRSELEFAAVLCNPTGFSLHFGDSPTNDGGGGDSGTSSNDAEGHFNGVDFFVITNDFSPVPADLLIAETPFVPATGCSPLAGRILDQEFHITAAQPADTISPFALRLNPPLDNEGTPDAIWYLGVNRTIGNAARIGTGIVSLDLCLR